MFHHHGPTFEEREQQQQHTEEKLLEELLDYSRHPVKAFAEILTLLPALTPIQLSALADLTHMLTCELEPSDTLAYFVIRPKGGTTMTPTQQPLPIVTAGTKLALVATGYDKAGNVDAVPTDNSLTWAVSDTTLASIDNNGNLTIAADAPAGKTVSVTVQLAKALADGTTPSGSVDQPIGAGEIAQFIITTAPAA